MLAENRRVEIAPRRSAIDNRHAASEFLTAAVPGMMLSSESWTLVAVTAPIDFSGRDRWICPSIASSARSPAAGGLSAGCERCHEPSAGPPQGRRRPSRRDRAQREGAHRPLRAPCRLAVPLRARHQGEPRRVPRLVGRRASAVLGRHQRPVAQPLRPGERPQHGDADAGIDRLLRLAPRGGFVVALRSGFWLADPTARSAQGLRRPVRSSAPPLQRRPLRPAGPPPRRQHERRARRGHRQRFSGSIPISR